MSQSFVLLIAAKYYDLGKQVAKSLLYMCFRFTLTVYIQYVV